MTEPAPEENRRLTVFLVDDHAMFRAGVRAELGAHVDVVGEGKPLGDEAAELLGAAKHFAAVALDHESYFHDSVCSSEVSSVVMRVSPKSARRRR